jgi:formate dehydrogenase subunit gamma
MATVVERFDEKARRAFERLGRTEVYVGELMRHPVYTRFLHWMVALFFFLALFSGFSLYLPFLFHWLTPIFGGGPMARALHPWFGLIFVFFFGLQMLNWLRPMVWTKADTNWIRNIKGVVSGEDKLEPPDTGFFNAGQKAMFWEIVIGCVLYLITGIILWAGTQTFGRWPVAVSYILHDISAIVMLGGIFIHIYLSTVGEPGTFQAMTRGSVSEPWAWTFHPAWYKEVTGRDPRHAYEEALGKRKD